MELNENFSQNTIVLQRVGYTFENTIRVTWNLSRKKKTNVYLINTLSNEKLLVSLTTSLNFLSLMYEKQEILPENLLTSPYILLTLLTVLADLSQNFVIILA